MEKWFQALNICREKGIPPEWITRPKLYKEHHQAHARAVVLRELSEKYSLQELLVLCPLTLSGMRFILREKKDLVLPGGV